MLSSFFSLGTKRFCCDLHVSIKYETITTFMNIETENHQILQIDKIPGREN